MTDSKGATVQKAFPGMAVIVSGWKSLPKAGDEVLEGSDVNIKKALSNRIRKAEAEAMQQDIEAINATRGQEREARAEGANAAPVIETPMGPNQLKLYIKADVSGSGEALEGALNGMGNHVAVSKVIGTGVGDITESDVMKAQAAKGVFATQFFSWFFLSSNALLATIIGFSVSVPRAVRNMAAQNAVPIFTSDIIYRLIDDVRGSLVSMLPTIKETKVIGEANVLEVFDIQLKGGKTMKVAGCRVVNGIIEKQKSVRVVRSGEIIYEGESDSI
jgi:translation initiation factor IF-2